MHNCDANAMCTKTNGSFTCACNPGWAAVPGTVQGTDCLDFDACGQGMFVTAAPGWTNVPGLMDGVNMNTLFDPNGAYVKPVPGLANCDIVRFIVIDLGAVREVSSIVYYPFWLDARKFCSQSIAVSDSGNFTGEEIVLFSCTTYNDCGSETSAGRAAHITAPIATRYVRLQMSRNTINAGVYILEAIVKYTHGNTQCDANAQCVDTVGPFTCACDNGYLGNGT
eukprot:3265501-Rhodomonas_salina.1